MESTDMNDEDLKAAYEAQIAHTQEQQVAHGLGLIGGSTLHYPSPVAVIDAKRALKELRGVTVEAALRLNVAHTVEMLVADARVIEAYLTGEEWRNKAADNSSLTPDPSPWRFKGHWVDGSAGAPVPVPVTSNNWSPIQRFDPSAAYATDHFLVWLVDADGRGWFEHAWHDGIFQGAWRHVDDAPDINKLEPVAFKLIEGPDMDDLAHIIKHHGFDV